MSGVLVAHPNNRSSPNNSSVSGILSTEGELLLTTEPSFVVWEELGIDIIKDGVGTFVVVVSNVK